LLAGDAAHDEPEHDEDSVDQQTDAEDQRRTSGVSENGDSSANDRKRRDK
jgi:hypothetical protein